MCSFDVNNYKGLFLFITYLLNSYKWLMFKFVILVVILYYLYDVFYYKKLLNKLILSHYRLDMSMINEL